MPGEASEPPAFADVVDELRSPLLRYLRRYVDDDHLAEDLLQESLLKIAGGLASLRQPASLRTWAFRIATRTAIDHLRASQRQAETMPFDESEPATDDFELAGERLVVREMDSCIREQIDRLPEDYRAALFLHDLEGLSAAETAEITGCSVATAKIRIHRARQRLRKILEQDCSFYYDRDQVLRCDRRRTDGSA